MRKTYRRSHLIHALVLYDWSAKGCELCSYEGSNRGIVWTSRHLEVGAETQWGMMIGG